jgi:Fe-S cluster biosynthesis and repair protein YggX
MAQALLGGLLPAVFSGADQLKRGVYGLLTNPQEQAERAAQNLLQSRAERQALMARTFANPERPFQVTDQAGLSQLTDQVMSGELGFAPAGITAFHGTPHNILGKFDINKVGTGEGAQAYGHGMYFAENPSVAKEYIVNAQLQKTPEGMARSYAQQYPSEKEALIGAKERLQRLLDSGDIAQAKTQKQIVNALETGNLGGNLYKVDIPDEYVPKMLDWDKPLSQQPKSVQDALAKIDPDSYSPKGMDYDPSELGQTIYHRLAQKSDEPLRQEWVKKRDMLLEKGLTNNPELEAHLMTNPNPYQVGSQVLNEYGIKGIRYLDEGSRGNYKARTTYKGEPYGEVVSFKTKNQLDDYIKQKKEEGFGVETFPQTSNFVVFDPTDVKILERNNQPFEGLLGN